MTDLDVMSYVYIIQACARSCWTLPTAQNTKVNCSAKCAMHVNSDQKATASVVVLAACPWTVANT